MSKRRHNALEDVSLRKIINIKSCCKKKHKKRKHKVKQTRTQAKNGRKCPLMEKFCPLRLDAMSKPAYYNVASTLKLHGYILEPERVTKLVGLMTNMQNPKCRPKKAKPKKPKKVRRKTQNKAKLRRQWLKKQTKRTCRKCIQYLKSSPRFVPSYKQNKVAAKIFKYLHFKRMQFSNKYVVEELKLLCQKLAVIADTKLKPYKQRIMVDKIKTDAAPKFQKKQCLFRMPSGGFQLDLDESEEETEEEDEFEDGRQSKLGLAEGSDKVTEDEDEIEGEAEEKWSYVEVRSVSVLAGEEDIEDADEFGNKMIQDIYRREDEEDSEEDYEEVPEKPSVEEYMRDLLGGLLSNVHSVEHLTPEQHAEWAVPLSEIDIEPLPDLGPIPLTEPSKTTTEIPKEPEEVQWFGSGPVPMTDPDYGDPMIHWSMRMILKQIPEFESDPALRSLESMEIESSIILEPRVDSIVLETWKLEETKPAEIDTIEFGEGLEEDEEVEVLGRRSVRWQLYEENGESPSSSDQVDLEEFPEPKFTKYRQSMVIQPDELPEIVIIDQPTETEYLMQVIEFGSDSEESLAVPLATLDMADEELAPLSVDLEEASIPDASPISFDLGDQGILMSVEMIAEPESGLIAKYSGMLKKSAARMKSLKSVTFIQGAEDEDRRKSLPIDVELIYYLETQLGPEPIIDTDTYGYYEGYPEGDIEDEAKYKEPFRTRSVPLAEPESIPSSQLQILPRYHLEETSSFVDWSLYVSWLKELGYNIELYASCLKQFEAALASHKLSKYQDYIRTLLKNWTNYLVESREVDANMTEYFKDKPITWCDTCRECSIDDLPAGHYIPPELEQVIATTKEWRRLLIDAETYWRTLLERLNAEGDTEGAEIAIEICYLGRMSRSGFDIKQL